MAVDLEAMIRNGESDAPLAVTSFPLPNGEVGYRVEETRRVWQNMPVEIRDENGGRRMTVYDTTFTEPNLIRGQSMDLRFRP